MADEAELPAEEFRQKQHFKRQMQAQVRQCRVVGFMGLGLEGLQALWGQSYKDLGHYWHLCPDMGYLGPLELSCACARAPIAVGQVKEGKSSERN